MRDEPAAALPSRRRSDPPPGRDRSRRRRWSRIASSVAARSGWRSVVPGGGRRAVGQEARPRGRKRAPAARCRPAIDRLRYSSTRNPSRASRMAGSITAANGSRPIPAMRLGQPGHGSGHAGGEMAGDAPIGRLAARVEIHVARGPGRRGLPVVERLHRAVAEADDHEAAAAEVARLGVHHRQGEANSDRGIHRVAALLQDVPADLARDAGCPTPPSPGRPRRPARVRLNAQPARDAGRGAGAGGAGVGPQARAASRHETERARRSQAHARPRGDEGKVDPEVAPGDARSSNLAVPDDYLDPRLTERRNPRSSTIDTASALEIVDLIGAEDAAVPAAVAKAREEIARAIDLIEAAFRAGGRLLYVGAGTSGRLGVLDAAECPPTFGTPPEMVVGVIAGGLPALVKSIEGAEDDVNAGIGEMDARRVGPNDVVVGIAASGTTPYVRAALVPRPDARRPDRPGLHVGAVAPAARDLRRLHHRAGGPRDRHRLHPDEERAPPPSWCSTPSPPGAMIRLGKIYGNLMVDLRAWNDKLVDRSQRILMETTGLGRDESRAVLEAAGGSVKTAIVMARRGRRPRGGGAAPGGARRPAPHHRGRPSAGAHRMTERPDARRRAHVGHLARRDGRGAGPAARAHPRRAARLRHPALHRRRARRAPPARSPAATRRRSRGSTSAWRSGRRRRWRRCWCRRRCRRRSWRSSRSTARRSGTSRRPSPGSSASRRCWPSGSASGW